MSPTPLERSPPQQPLLRPVALLPLLALRPAALRPLADRADKVHRLADAVPDVADKPHLQHRSILRKTRWSATVSIPSFPAQSMTPFGALLKPSRATWSA